MGGGGVQGAGAVLHAVDGWIDHAHGWPVFLTRDVDPFAGTGARARREAELHPVLAGRGTVVEKGPGSRGGFSGFVLLSTANPAGLPGGGGLSDLAGLLRSANIERVIVVGLAADVCVSATAMDARRLGYQVDIARDATAFVHTHPEGDEAALAELREHGVILLEHSSTRPGTDL